MRRPNRRPNYTKTEDITNWEETVDYIIHQDGTVAIAVDGNTGKEVSRNTDAYIVIAYCLTQLATGGHVHIKHGTYTIDTALAPASWTWISGDGQNRTILFLEAETVINMIYADGKDHVRISDLTIDGNQANQTDGGSSDTQCGILITDSDSWLIDNCEIKNATEVGIHFYVGSLTNTVSNCYIHDNFHRGINLYTGSTNCRIINNDFEDNVDYGLSAHVGITGLKVIGNDFTGTGRGIWIQDATSLLLNTNTCHDIAIAGMDIGASGHPVTDSHIVGNYYYNCDVYQGIKITDSDRISITSNAFYSSALADDEGIQIAADCTTIIVTANTFVNMVRGVDVDGDDCIFNWNIFLNCTTPIDDNGERNIIDGMSLNAGVPGAAGVWAATLHEGVIVRDTTNNKTYICAEAGWREISAA